MEIYSEIEKFSLLFKNRKLGKTFRELKMEVFGACTIIVLATICFGLYLLNEEVNGSDDFLNNIAKVAIICAIGLTYIVSFIFPSWNFVFRELHGFLFLSLTLYLMIDKVEEMEDERSDLTKIMKDELAVEEKVKAVLLVYETKLKDNIQLIVYFTGFFFSFATVFKGAKNDVLWDLLLVALPVVAPPITCTYTSKIDVKWQDSLLLSIFIFSLICFERYSSLLNLKATFAYVSKPDFESKTSEKEELTMTIKNDEITYATSFLKSLAGCKSGQAVELNDFFVPSLVVNPNKNDQNKLKSLLEADNVIVRSKMTKEVYLLQKSTNNQLVELTFSHVSTSLSLNMFLYKMTIFMSRDKFQRDKESVNFANFVYCFFYPQSVRKQVSVKELEDCLRSITTSVSFLDIPDDLLVSVDLPQIKAAVFSLFQADSETKGTIDVIMKENILVIDFKEIPLSQLEETFLQQAYCTNVNNEYTLLTERKIELSEITIKVDEHVEQWPDIDYNSIASRTLSEDDFLVSKKRRTSCVMLVSNDKDALNNYVNNQENGDLLEHFGDQLKAVTALMIKAKMNVKIKEMVVCFPRKDKYTKLLECFVTSAVEKELISEFPINFVEKRKELSNL